MSDWQDRIVSERMTVDNEFDDRIRQSGFSNQEWGLIMTATEFEIENPGTDDAELVANTENLPQIMPELENIRSQMGGMGGGGGGGDGSSGSGGGLFDSIKGALGMGGGNDERLEEARELTQEYADELQKQLESKGKWEDVQQVAKEDP